MNADPDLIQLLQNIRATMDEKDCPFFSVPGGDELIFETLVKRFGTSLQKKYPDGPTTFSMEIEFGTGTLALSDYGNLAFFYTQHEIDGKLIRTISESLAIHHWRLVPDDLAKERASNDPDVTWRDLLAHYL